MNNFYYAYNLLETLYGVSMEEDIFEETALVAWNQIGNKRCKIYRQHICNTTCSKQVELPCNCDILDAVTASWEDFQATWNITNRSKPGSFNTEQYIEHMKAFNDKLYASGKFIPYERVGNTLYFEHPYQDINILYRGVVLDDNGLPELTDKEALAIATYCAYVDKYKKGLQLNNGQIIQIAQSLQKEWTKLVNQARTDYHMSQNDWDEILDAKNNWNRKLFNRSFKINA